MALICISGFFFNDLFMCNKKKKEEIKEIREHIK